MTRVTVRCTSLEPLLMNSFKNSRLLDATIVDRKTPVPAEDFLEARFYRDAQGRVGLPSVLLMSALKFSARFVGPRRCRTTVVGTRVPEIVQIEEEFLLLDNGQPGTEAVWERDVVAARCGGGSRIRVPLIRPRFDRWAFTATLRFNQAEVGEALIRQLVEEAGDKAGLGDFRPSAGGYCGRFRIAGWRVEATESALPMIGASA